MAEIHPLVMKLSIQLFILISAISCDFVAKSSCDKSTQLGDESLRVSSDSTHRRYRNILDSNGGSSEIDGDQKPFDLSNTKWEFKVADDCINYLEFVDNEKYIEYDCEATFSFYGKYGAKGDTIFLYESDINDSSRISKVHPIINISRDSIEIKGFANHKLVYKRVL